MLYNHPYIGPTSKNEGVLEMSLAIKPRKHKTNPPQSRRALARDLGPHPRSLVKMTSQSARGLGPRSRSVASTASEHRTEPRHVSPVGLTNTLPSDARQTNRTITIVTVLIRERGGDRGRALGATTAGKRSGKPHVLVPAAALPPCGRSLALGGKCTDGYGSEIQSGPQGSAFGPRQGSIGRAGREARLIPSLPVSDFDCASAVGSRGYPHRPPPGGRDFSATLKLATGRLAPGCGTTG